jgi:hypothetical protein
MIESDAYRPCSNHYIAFINISHLEAVFLLFLGVEYSNEVSLQSERLLARDSPGS